MAKNLKPAIILVHPQMGENIGAAARAMANFGLEDLRLVKPRDGWPNKAALDVGAGAFDLMPPVKVFETLGDCLSDINTSFALTARPRDMIKPVVSAEHACQAAFKKISASQKIGFVFGPERTGLENDDLCLCSTIVTINTNPALPSINLAQSVVLIAYEYSRILQNDNTAPQSDITPAPFEHLSALLQRLEQELERGKFFKEDNLKPTTMRNVMNMFTRAGWTEQEVRTFHGMMTALQKKD